MAYDAYWQDAFSGKPNHRLEIYVRRDGVSGNSSTYWWQLTARRTSGAVSWIYDPQPWWVYNGKGVVSGSAGLGFSSSTSVLVLASGYSGWIAHDSNGYLNIWVDGKMQAGNGFGEAYAGGTFVTDRIAQIPGKPPKSTILDTTITSVKLQISGPNNGGSAIITYRHQIGTTPNFPGGTGGVIQTWLSPASLQERTGLPVGTQLYHRFQAQNGVGWGPYSDATPFTTKSGVFAGFGASYVGAEVLVGIGGEYVTADLYLPNPAGNNFQAINTIYRDPTIEDIHPAADAKSAVLDIPDVPSAASVVIQRSIYEEFRADASTVTTQIPYRSDGAYPVTGITPVPYLYWRALIRTSSGTEAGWWSGILRQQMIY